ncbi:DUF2207 domain-containing protein [Candidatus Peregrinibacteria bacterium]|nr:DUF2207 domain-containing protein [Candidatus Peregrinibacteria bacterium]
MKKALAILGLFLIWIPATYAYAPWNFPEINQDITVMESGKIRVVETIQADFTNDGHRGIYREIPLQYKNEFGNPLNLRFSLISVNDENGNPHPIADQGNSWGTYTLRIGDPDTLRNDVATYVITYEIDRALGYFDDHQELYWNIFTDWDVPVLESSATVHLPEDKASSINEDELRAVCYTGTIGSVETKCTAEIVDKTTFRYTMNNTAPPGEAFTIVAGWPANIIESPSLLASVWWFITDNWTLLIPVIVFLLLYWRWYTTGRDPKTKDTIIPRYKPPKGLTPTEVGTIIDEKVDLQDITSVVITYAVKGFIKIREIKEKKFFFFDDMDYELELIKEYAQDKEIQSHERTILDNIFNGKKKVKISDLRYKFYKKLSSIKKDIYNNLVKGKYFAHNPEHIKAMYMGVGIAVITITLSLAGLLFSWLGLTGIIAIVVSGALIIGFSFIMPRKTLKGAQTLIEIKGLEEYIRTAERDRIKFQEDQNLFFEQLLPYAMVLGLGEKWAQAFEELYQKPPAWFSGNDMQNFNTYYLVNRLNNFSNHAKTAFASSPRSSGSSAWSGGSGFSGGFSGGGFGGGGGGGW